MSPGYVEYAALREMLFNFAPAPTQLPLGRAAAQDLHAQFIALASASRGFLNCVSVRISEPFRSAVGTPMQP
jgi:hypothetical protein